MLQSMALSLLKVVAPIQRVEPRVQEILSPVPTPDDHAAAGKTLLILAEHEVDPLALQVWERLDHAVGGHDGLVDDHEGFETPRLHDVRVEGDGRVHD